MLSIVKKMRLESTQAKYLLKKVIKINCEIMNSSSRVFPQLPEERNNAKLFMLFIGSKFCFLWLFIDDNFCFLWLFIGDKFCFLWLFMGSKLCFLWLFIGSKFCFLWLFIGSTFFFII